MSEAEFNKNGTIEVTRNTFEGEPLITGWVWVGICGIRACTMHKVVDIAPFCLHSNLYLTGS